MARVELKSIHKSFGKNVIIPNLDLEIESGEFVALVGPSGCGKSTLLRMVAGLEDPTSGTLKIDGQIVNEVSPKERGIAMVFQNYALYPHLSVYDNLAFALKMSKIDAKEIMRRIGDVAEILGLSELLERKPAQLSGGQKQRVAMGRAMVRQPKVLLFDEPLSNLDAQLRIKVRSEIALLHKRVKSTVIYVTHDQVEAMTLADRIAVLNKGNLEQYAAPLKVYHQPKTQFVANFIGTPPMNFISSQLLPAREVPAGAVLAGFRSESTRISTPSAQPGDWIPIGEGRVSLIEPLGSTSFVHLKLGSDTLIAELPKHAIIPEWDARTDVWANAKELFFFDETGNRVS
jgi:multiple sugar transport system ATP-binding protein